MSGGLLVYNADVVTRPVKRDDVTALAVHASAEAQALGNSRLMNVVTLGVWAAKKGDVLDRDALVEGLRHMAKHAEAVRAELPRPGPRAGAGARAGGAGGRASAPLRRAVSG